MYSMYSHEKRRTGITLLVICLCLLAGVTQALAATGFTDALTFGDAKSEKAHQVAITGQAAREWLATTMGALTDSRMVRTLQGPGSSISFELAAGGDAEASAVLELQEVHNRRPSAFGYIVLVNDTEVYFRTYQEMGTGPVHYFVNVPPKLLAAQPRVRVTMRNEGGAAWSISQVWWYRDFFNDLAKRERVYRPMGIYSDPANADTGEKTLEAQWKKFKETYSGFTDYAPAGGYVQGGAYAGNLYANQYRIDQSINAIVASDMGALYPPNATAWGGAMGGPDGRGGDFSDLQYSRVNINPVTGIENVSWPNLWANSMTPTYANPHYNQVLRQRFDKVTSYLSDRLAFTMARGTLPIGEMQFARELGIDVGEDFHPEYVKTARADGITLDPRGGLNLPAREWLFNTTTRIYDWMGKDFAAALGRNPVRVDHGQITLPTYQFADNLYNHVGGGQRILPRSWESWQTGMTKESWASGEIVGTTGLQPCADYIRARGKLSKVNQERGTLKNNFAICKSLYEQGFQFMYFYNLRAGDDKLLQAVDKVDDQPSMPAIHCEPNCLESNLSNGDPMGTPEQIVAIDNLEARETPCPHHTRKMVVKDIARPGSILYHLSNNGADFPSGLSLFAMGRIAPGDANKIEVRVGETPQQLATVYTMSSKDLPYPENWTPHATRSTIVPLGEGAKGKKDYYLRLVLHAEKAYDATFLHEVRVGMTWPRQSGYLTGDRFTIGQSRVLSLWAQDRAVAARLLERYRTLGSEDGEWTKAKALFDAGYYRSAYAALVGKFSELLPARYAILGNGQLGRYPVSVQLPDTNNTAVIDLTQVNASGIEFTVKTEIKQAIQVTFSGAKSGRTYALMSSGPNRYAIVPASKAHTAQVAKAEEGCVTFTVPVEPPANTLKALPENINGSFREGSKQSIRIDIGDLDLSQNTGFLNLPLATNATVTREADRLQATQLPKGQTWPLKNDRVDLTLNAAGQVTSIKAVYGLDKGRIKAFTPPSIATGCNGIIELEDGQRYEFSPYTVCDTLYMHSALRQYEIRSLAVALQPGDEIEISYCPYTYKGSLPRIISLNQPYEVVKDLNYTKITGDEWTNDVVEVKDATVEPHPLDPSYLPHYIKPVLYPKIDFTPGYVVYKFQREKPFDRTLVEYMARVFEDSSRMEFFVGDDNQAWTKVWQFDNSCMSFMPLDGGALTFFDITNQVKGKRTFYLKIQLTHHADDHRFGLLGVRVLTKPQ